MYKQIAIVALSAGYAHAQSGLAVAMYVPHALQTVTGTVPGTWKGSFEAPLTVGPRGNKASWAAFCVDDEAATCFSEPVSDIATGEYTEAGALIPFEVTNIPIPANSSDAPGVVCYVATVFDKGQICSKPVLDYEEVGLVSNSNNHWVSRNIDLLSKAAENPIISKISDAARETVEMVQNAFGNLQRDAAKDIEDHVAAFDAPALEQQLADEIQAIADKIRPEVAGPVAEPVAELMAPAPEPVAENAVPEVYGTAVITPLPMPEAAVPTETAFVEEIVEVIEPEVVVPEVYGSAVITPLPVPEPAAEPYPEAPLVDLPPTDPMPMPAI